VCWLRLAAVVMNELWKSRYDYGAGEPMNYETASAVAAGVVFRIAVERANSWNRTAVLAAMRSIDEMTFFGRFKFNSNQRNVGHAPAAIQWHCDGATCMERSILPDSFASATLEPYSSGCPDGSIPLISPEAGVNFTCVPCLDAEPLFISSSLLLESQARDPASPAPQRLPRAQAAHRRAGAQGSVGESIRAVCPVFSTPVPIHVTFEGAAAEMFRLGAQLALKTVTGDEVRG
jgi:hypothetical protein